MVIAELHCAGVLVGRANCTGFTPFPGVELWTPLLPGIEHGTREGAPGQQGSWRVVKVHAWVAEGEVHIPTRFIEVEPANAPAAWVLEKAR